MATHSSILAWRIAGMGEPRGLPSMGLQSRTRLKRLSSSREVTLGQEAECQQSIRDEITGNADVGRLPLWTAKA